ncbi:NUDIX pyrophosphatase [bacterium]|nr:NUDIX pyrophosphatase [bacterium]
MLLFDCFVVNKINDDYRFLMLKRAKGKMYEGMWRMVAGKIKPNEKAWEACLREIQEETNLKIDELYSVPFVNSFYEWETDSIHSIPVFLAITKESKVTMNDEHDKYEWLYIDEAISRLEWPGQKKGIEESFKMLTNKQMKQLLRIKLEN